MSNSKTRSVRQMVLRWRFDHWLATRREIETTRSMGDRLQHACEQWLAGVQGPASERKRVPGADHIDAIGFDADAFFDLTHGHRGAPAQNLRHQALVLGREVLNDYIRHAAVRRARCEEGPQHLDAPGRGANSHYGKGERGPSRKVDRCGCLVGCTRGRRGRGDGRDLDRLDSWWIPTDLEGFVQAGAPLRYC